MKHYFSISLITLTLLFIFSCSNTEPTKGYALLSPAEFSSTIQKTADATIIDVRTPEEYANGHLIHAKNINWNGSDFEKQISLLDTSKPVFIYCLSGGRSSDAARKLISMGFSKIYELDGGILKWRSAEFPETNTKDTAIGMSKQEFDALLVSDKLILIDFYASWCAPCKKMESDLKELAEEMKNEITILRIDADENQTLFKELQLETLPTLLLYKNNDLVWSHVGYINKEGISENLKKF